MYMLEHVLSPGDRPDFIEGFHSLHGLLANMDTAFYVVQKLAQLVDLAEQARDQLGKSYRAFRVGCAVLAIDNSRSKIGIYFGGNYTPYKGAEWNCAEKRALESTGKKGFNGILAIAVVGKPQKDNSGVTSDTLHPCSRCRDMFESSTLIKPDTLVLTATPELDEFELHTADSLALRHKTGNVQDFPNYHPSLHAYWEQLLVMNKNAETDRREAEALKRIPETFH